MDDLSILEESYKRYMKNLGHWLPEGLVRVDLELLKELDLLSYDKPEIINPALTRHFHIMESNEKITLFNNQFVVWIIPDRHADLPVTFALIALSAPEGPLLETGFLAEGVYNSSRLVLQILEKFLVDIQENEEALIDLKKAS